MRIAYLDCFAGISGDMFLGALLDAGVPSGVLHDAVAALGLGASLQIGTVDRSGISATRVVVLEDGEPVESQGAHPHKHEHEKRHTPADHTHEASHGHTHEVHAHEHSHEKHEHEEHGHTHEKHEHSHEHPHGEKHGGHRHVHGRSLPEIRGLILAADLPAAVKKRAVRTFELLGHSEAKIHNVPVEAIHFHEVGAVDSIVDIVAASAGIEYLNEAGEIAWHASPVNVGGGMVECAHGTFPVPAPATADLLRGLPTYSAHVEKELVTPTGAALLRALNPVFGPQPAMHVGSIGYGAGTRDPKHFPNVLRLSVGEPTSMGAAHDEGKAIIVLETALDDSSPQVLAHVAERALAAGALDAMLAPVTMKKGRPGTLVTVLCNEADALALEDLLLRETSTLGVRRRQEHRVCLERRYVEVETPFGPVRLKVGERAGEVLNVAPEFEDCRAAAAACGIAVKQVMQAALAAYPVDAVALTVRG